MNASLVSNHNDFFSRIGCVVNSLKEIKQSKETSDIDEKNIEPERDNDHIDKVIKDSETNTDNIDTAPTSKDDNIKTVSINEDIPEWKRRRKVTNKRLLEGKHPSI